MPLNVRAGARWFWLGSLTVTAVLLAAPVEQRRVVPRGSATTASTRFTPPANGSYRTIQLSGSWQRAHDLAAGQVVEISVHLSRPSALPPNGRVAVEWGLQNSPFAVSEARDEARKPDAFGIYTRPTADWRKVLHALDCDVYMVYRAPISGRYLLRLQPVTDEAPVGASPRWRERGNAPELFPLPRSTPWPAGTVAPVEISVHPLVLEPDHASRTVVECEPNDTPEQAQVLTLMPAEGDEVRTWEITGGADEVEFFDNGRVGSSGDDWFRLEFTGKEPRLVTAQLSMPGQFLAARLRWYEVKPSAVAASPGALLALDEYKHGQDPNERVHQQDEEHRANASRVLQPGGTYFLRVEANTPGYQLQLRVLRAAPYADPRMAIRQGMYNHIGQVDSWLTNRPRGASIERRLRDSGNLLGTQCMSCHTQSGVWGPAAPLANGYRIENVQNYWHLVNVMYECLRPTNELKDAANNTSLAPLDIGDGPAGTRTAGFNIVNLERFLAPRALHSKQQLRTANFVLQTADPGAINAAGPGGNIGQVIVYLFAGEVLRTAWEKTGDSKYFQALEDKARKVLAVTPKFTDDVASRIDFFTRVFPIREGGLTLSGAERATSMKPEERTRFFEQVRAQLARDEARLRALQRPDGTWGFNPGDEKELVARGKSVPGDPDPSPTALAVFALTGLGYGKDDPAIARGVQALLAMQEPAGRWNRAALTGFVSTSYTLHALSRLYPMEPTTVRVAAFAPPPRESLLAAIHRVRRLALSGGVGARLEGDPLPLLVAAAKHESPLVRYWAMIGLGGRHAEAGVPSLIDGLGDRVKMVRDASQWALRQTLLDDHGWEAVLAASEQGDDVTRESAVQALNLRADAVMPQARVNWSRLAAVFDRAMNADPHPAVRAWATKAAWQWWVWNPPLREAVNDAWVKLLTRPETNALVEHNTRYASEMLFIANGHKANSSRQHQYKELATLMTALRERLEQAEAETKLRLVRRLVGIAGTFYATSGGDGGPGQMGYATPGADRLLGQAVLMYLSEATGANPASAVPEFRLIRAGLEGAANIPFAPLTKFLVDYSLKGPEELRQLAASSVSDARSVSLAAVPELVGPQLEQILRGAMEPGRRAQISDPIIDLWGKVNWVIPQTLEQQRAFFDLIIPKLDEYHSAAELAALPDAAQRAIAERNLDASWYLAGRLGAALNANPDLHHDGVFRHYFPTGARNPLQTHFWLPSVGWLLTHKSIPANPGGEAERGNAVPDTALVIKDRALQLYLDALQPSAPARTRAIAIRMANQTALRSQPEVLVALSKVLQFEPNEELKKIATNVLQQGTENFMRDLLAAMKRERDASVPFENDEPRPTKAQTEDVVYFRDYVMPELTRQKRDDQLSCFGCHAVPGRVPSLTLRPTDEFGYINASDLLTNYRLLQKRVDLNNLEKSRLLRKPLNVQDGNEDGHQGGRRYAPGDEGYLLLKRWVGNQPAVQKPAAGK